MPYWGQYYLQDWTGTDFYFITILHECAFRLCLFIALFVSLGLSVAWADEHIGLWLWHAELTEIVYTGAPIVCLAILAYKSLVTLFYTDQIGGLYGFCDITVKTIAHQWYWRYEYSDYESLDYDSYITKDLFTPKDPYILGTRIHLVFPSHINIRFIITSDDVLHSWTVPSVGGKVDAIPGRLNILTIQLIKEGKYFGQCSEICGINHRMMPIRLEIISFYRFLEWRKIITSSISIN